MPMEQTMHGKRQRPTPRNYEHHGDTAILPTVMECELGNALAAIKNQPAVQANLSLDDTPKIYDSHDSPTNLSKIVSGNRFSSPKSFPPSFFSSKPVSSGTLSPDISISKLRSERSKWSLTNSSDHSRDVSTDSDWSRGFDKTESVLEVHNANFTVKTKNGPRKILDNISLAVKSKETLGLMGPSGAGKTSLLELLTLDLKGKATGRVTLNGEDFTGKTFADYCAFVEQHDRHRVFLTCKEIMTYAAEMCLVDKKEVREQVKDMLAHLGLTACADVRAGNMFVRGLSGGQRKRLSLGMHLLKAPKVLFLDEPTTGLDAASAERVMAYVDKSALEASMVVITTIHQPQTSVFLAFGEMAFLADGRLAYLGPPSGVTRFCNDLGKPVPAFTNPADHFMELINSSFVSQADVDKVVAAFRSMESDGRNDGENVCPRLMSSIRPLRRPSLWSLTWTLIRRQGLNSLRDPSIYIGRAVLFFVSQCFFAIVFIETRHRTQSVAEAKIIILSWILANPTIFAMLVVWGGNEEFKLRKKEIKHGLGSRLSSLLADFLWQIPYMSLLALSCLLPAYVIVNLAIAGFPHLFCIMVVFLWSFETLAEFCSIIHDTPFGGCFVFVNFWFTFFLFAGMLLREEDIIWPLRALCSLSPIRWSLHALVYVEYDKGGNWEGATLLTTGNGTTFRCDSPTVCYGVTGKQVLATLHKYFGGIDETDRFAQDNVLVVGIGAFFKVLHILLFIARTRTHPVLEESSEAQTSPQTTNFQSVCV